MLRKYFRDEILRQFSRKKGYLENIQELMYLKDSIRSVDITEDENTHFVFGKFSINITDLKYNL